MTSIFPDIAISTERLTLRAFEDEDVPALTEMMNDEPVTSWIAAPQPYAEADARDFVTRIAPAARAGGGLVLAVTEFLTQRLVGIVRLCATDWALRATRISFVTAAWARGEGYAGEALLSTAQWLFQDQKFERLELRTAAGNTAAQQVAHKAGCISEGVLRSAGTVRVHDEHGSWSRTRTDLIVWSLLPEDLDPDGRDGSGYDADPGWQVG